MPAKTLPSVLSQAVEAKAEYDVRLLAQQLGTSYRSLMYWIRGDRHLLSQALANLLDNALKYAGGGRIGIAVFRRDGQAVLEVADTGIENLSIDKTCCQGGVTDAFYHCREGFSRETIDKVRSA